MKRFAVWSLVLAPVLDRPASAGVFVVDGQTPGGFTDIQSAVDAASDGDTLLVKSGTYAGFALVDKELTVIGDELAGVHIDGTIRVEQLGAAKTVLLAGLHAKGDVAFDGNGLRLLDNDGIVWIEDCSVHASPSLACAEPFASTRIENSGAVVFVRSTLRGSDAAAGQGAGGEGVRVIDAAVLTHNCGMLGGAASWQACGKDPSNGATGGSSALVSGLSFLFTSADRYLAGEGGSGAHSAAGGDGGNGLIVVGPSQIESFDTMYVAGTGGLGGGCGSPECADGQPGEPIVGRVDLIAGVAATFTNGPPVREGMPFMVVVYGIPGERFAFDMSSVADFHYVPAQRGVRLTSGGRRFVLGHIPPSGVTGVLLTAPMLAAGEASRRIFLQSVHWGSSGPLTLGSMRAVVVLDSAF